MSDNLVPFWEKTYQEYDTITFSNQPNSTITEFEHLIGKPSKVLDVAELKEIGDEGHTVLCAV